MKPKIAETIKLNIAIMKQGSNKFRFLLIIIKKYSILKLASSIIRNI